MRKPDLVDVARHQSSCVDHDDVVIFLGVGLEQASNSRDGGPEEDEAVQHREPLRNGHANLKTPVELGGIQWGLITQCRGTGVGQSDGLAPATMAREERLAMALVDAAEFDERCRTQQPVPSDVRPSSCR